MRKKLLTFVASLAILAGGVFAYFAIASPAEAANVSFSSGECGKLDTSPNSIIKGGACSTDAMKSKVKGDVVDVFKHYKVPTNLAGAKKGEVRKNGDVVVDGKVVATGAQTVGRDKFGNSNKTITINGKKYYQGTPNERWGSNTTTMKAFVFFDKNGEFVSAVLTACGNPVKANPKPKPAYKCTSLTATPIQNSRTKFALEVKTSQHRATFSKVVFDVYDKNGKKVDSVPSTSKKHTYEQKKAGTYTIKATVTFNVQSGKSTVSKTVKCETKITVKEEPCPYNSKLPINHPDCEQIYKCKELTATIVGEVTDRTYKYNLTYAEKNAKLATVDFNFGDGNKKEGVKPNELNNVTHTYAKEGPYTTTATLQFTVGGKVKTAKCAVKITASPDKEEPCPYNPELPIGHPDCKPPKEEEPCPYNPALPVDHPDCVEPEEEVEPCPYNPELPKGSKDCVEPEEPEAIPVEIPKTGAGNLIGALLGFGSIGIAGYYYLVSRRELVGKFLGR